MRCACGLELLGVDWCWKAGHISPSPLCDEFPHGQTVVDVRVGVAQYDLRPYTCGVELLLRCFNQLVGPLPAVGIVRGSLPSMQVDDDQRCG